MTTREFDFQNNKHRSDKQSARTGNGAPVTGTGHRATVTPAGMFGSLKGLGTGCKLTNVRVHREFRHAISG
jgi:hypothetical protein